MNRRRFCLEAGSVLALAGAASLGAQDEFGVYTEHPRLLLSAQRSRLLRRERERASERWQNFERLMSGRAQMPEPGFAHALYYHVARSDESGRQAIQWAMTPNADPRQVAIVFDWCQPLLSDLESRQLRSRLQSIASAAPTDLPSARNRVFAAIAESEASGDASRKWLEPTVNRWWRTGFAPSLMSGERFAGPSEAYALLELMHAVRDNLNIDLRETAGQYFRDLPAIRVLSYYPPRYPAPENEYRIPFYAGKGDPDLREAALSRAADLSLIAYDNNLTEHQFLQGWISHDAFQLKSVFGCPYEFLWANPYQPGLSYHHLPLRMHDSRAGRLFLRSDWNEEAVWAGYVDGRLQIFQDGKIQTGTPGSVDKPLLVGGSAVAAGKPQMKWELRSEDPADWYIVGLKSRTAYEIEVDDEELAEGFSDRGGILALNLERRAGVGVRLRERTSLSGPSRATKLNG